MYSAISGHSQLRVNPDTTTVLIMDLRLNVTLPLSRRGTVVGEVRGDAQEGGWS